ncbi:hypothetical protein B4144_4149 [Bacillus atrophaeus]|nr:hypothetical protein B4144_4149 [Bacillus atrophaeus]
MWNAAMWGGISGSAVLLGALASMFLPIRKRIIGYIMAFGTGVLIGAAAYELLEDAVKDGGMVSTGAGFIAGAVVFTLFDYAVSKRGASQEKDRDKQLQAAGGSRFLSAPSWMLSPSLL